MHLITFGDSWTFGSGIQYSPAMSKDEYKEIFFENDGPIWRKILSRKLNCDHTNFAYSGSSNQAQFRLLLEFFNNGLYKKYSDPTILFGITSVYRTQQWCNSEKRLVDFLFTSKSDHRIDERTKKIWLKYFFDEFFESQELKNNIIHWNLFCKSLGVKIYWFDTFVHTPYFASDIKNMIQAENYYNVFGSDWPEYDDLLNLFIYDCPIFDTYIQEVYETWNVDLTSLVLENFIDFKQNGRDQLALLSRLNNVKYTNENTHRSDLDHSADDNYLLPFAYAGILNPYSFHPTRIAHEQIANYYYEILSNNK